MKKFILKRIMRHTETAEVEAESWDAAKAILEGDSVEFDVQHDGHLHDSSIEFIGEARQSNGDHKKLIYIDTKAGVSGSEAGLNGEAINPVDNYEDAKKLAEYYEKHGVTTGYQEI